MASLAGVRVPVMLAFSPAAIEAIGSPFCSNFQPVGGEPLSDTLVNGAVPVFLTVNSMSFAVPALAVVERTSLTVVSVIANEPVMPTLSSAVALLPPPLAVTVMGYTWAAASVGGVAVTLMVDDAPAATVTVVACASVVGSALTVQPSGPWVVNPNTISAGVSFLSVRLKSNVWSEEPLS